MRDNAVLLLGSYGQTNFGDDLLMWNYLTYLRDCGFGKIYVNANDSANIPDVIKQEFPDLIVIPHYQTSLLAWLKVLRQVGYVVYGGGTVYKELYGTTGRGRYSVIVRIMLFNFLARLVGARIYHLHIGIGVLKTWLGRTITRCSLATSNFIVFRDAQSYESAVATLKLSPKKLCQASDGLFMSDRWHRVWHKPDFRPPHGRYKRVVGVNVLSDIPDWIDKPAYLHAIREWIKGLLEDNNFVLLLPLQHEFNPHNDLAFMRREIVPYIKHYRNYQLVNQVPIDQAVAYFKQLDVFVGMRFHSLLLATVTGVPYVGLAYDTKCWRFMQEAGYPYGLKLENLRADTLAKMYDTLANNLTAAPAMLRVIAKKEHQKGQACLKKLPF